MSSIAITDSYRYMRKDAEKRDINFEVIHDEQTPMVPIIEGSVQNYIHENKDVFLEFLEFASKRPNCVGLAANQCSYKNERFMYRVFAKFVYPTIGGDKSWELFIDPKIIEYGGIKTKRTEGCLTWPKNNIVADRYTDIKVSYYTIDGKNIETEMTGFAAQVFQHEMNHLDGVEEKVVKKGYKPSKVKIGRNDSCPCGSEKKFKKCCIKKYQELM